MRLSVGRWVATIATMGLVACSADLVNPTKVPAGYSAIPSSLNASRSKSKRTSNRIKYRDRGEKPGKGKAGNATLEVRALLGSDGSTTIEMSTGAVETGAGPGTIERVQVKVLGTRLPVRNFRDVDAAGFWSLSLGGLKSGDQVQVQANVTGIDRKRTDVVTAIARVVRRPDPAVASVIGPDEAPADVPVGLAASIVERNGDMGARADCVLSVDGLAVDRASGIWVDAGGTVNCTFLRPLAAGTHTVTVSLANVVPTDWDASNNSASRTIVVVNPRPPVVDPTNILHGTIEAKRVDRTWTDRSTNDGPSGYVLTESGRESSSSVSVSAYDPTAIQLPLQSVEFRITVDGAPTFSRVVTEPTSTSDLDDGTTFQHCWLFNEGADFAQACTFGTYGGDAQTSYQLYRLEGEATYSGSRTWCTGCPPDGYGESWVAGSGAAFPFGSTLGVYAVFVDAAAGNHLIVKTLPIRDLSSEVNISTTEVTEDIDRGGMTTRIVNSTGSKFYGIILW